MLNIYDCTPTVGISNVYDNINYNNIIEVRGLRANNWNNATVVNKYMEKQDNTDVFIIEVYMRKNIYKLIDLNYFQSKYNDSYDYEKNIKYIRACKLANVKNIYTYENGRSKEEAITSALIKYGVINTNILEQNNFKLTIHSNSNRLNGRKYIKLWNKDNIIGEFWVKEPNTIDSSNKLLPTWEIDLTKKA